MLYYKNHNKDSTIKSVKQKRTYYTHEKVDAARTNIRMYQWAKDIMNEAVENAEYYLSLGFDYLWNLVTSQSIPRSAAVCDDGCPVCGKGINKFGHYPWIADSVNMPWKLKCPNCGTIL